MSNVIIIFVRKKHECIFSCIMHVRCETIDYLFWFARHNASSYCYDYFRRKCKSQTLISLDTVEVGKDEGFLLLKCIY